MKRTLMASFVAALLLPALPCPAQQHAVTELSVSFLRETPNYAGELGSQCLMGTEVEIVGSDSYWRKIVAPDYTAWVNERALVEMSDDEFAAYQAAPKYICTAEYTSMFSTPSMKSDRISDLVMGDILRQGDGRHGRFCKVILPSGKEGWVLRKAVEDYDSWEASRAFDFPSLWAVAKLFIGTPYMWGGTSIKGVDCSGLVSFCCRMCGVNVPRNASQQVKLGVEVPVDVKDGWSEEAIASMQPGDLIFYGRAATPEKREGISHVAIYIGEGRIIHSSQQVRVSSLRADGDDPYTRQPLHVRRIMANGKLIENQ